MRWAFITASPDASVGPSSAASTRITGQDYSHRKEWILDRLRELAGLFASEVCGFSVMSNHLVLRNRLDIAGRWSADEIALRWCRVFPPRDDATGEPVEPGIHDLGMVANNSERPAELRQRLSSLSWFMFKQSAGRPSSLVDAAARRSRRWFQGKAAARTAFV